MLSITAHPIKITMKYHLALVRMAIIKEKKGDKCCLGFGGKGREPLYTVDRSVN